MKSSCFRPLGAETRVPSCLAPIKQSFCLLSYIALLNPSDHTTVTQHSTKQWHNVWLPFLAIALLKCDPQTLRIHPFKYMQCNGHRVIRRAMSTIWEHCHLHHPVSMALPVQNNSCKWNQIIACALSCLAFFHLAKCSQVLSS